MPNAQTMPAPMRQMELREHAECSLCKRPVGHTGLPLFWRVRIDRFGIDFGAMRRYAGFIALLGGHAGLAHAMGPDEELAKPMMDTVTLTICEECVMGEHCIAALAERERAEEQNDAG
jgi:hypothetical protein